MDNEIADAGLSLIAKKLEDYSPFGIVNVLNITRVRQIASAVLISWAAFTQKVHIRPFLLLAGRI